MSWFKKPVISNLPSERDPPSHYPCQLLDSYIFIFQKLPGALETNEDAPSRFQEEFSLSVVKEMTSAGAYYRKCKEWMVQRSLDQRKGSAQQHRLCGGNCCARKVVHGASNPLFLACLHIYSRTSSKLTNTMNIFVATWSLDRVSFQHWQIPRHPAFSS